MPCWHREQSDPEMMMVLIDTHTHLYLPHFTNDIEQVIHNAVKNNVIKMLLPNIDLDSIMPMLELCRRFPSRCYPMLGLHPTSVRSDFHRQLETLESYKGKEEFMAIGEIGLDAYWSTDYMARQEEAFILQLEWAKIMDLPVVIHSRLTMDRILEILGLHTGEGLKGVLHAFSGTLKQAEIAVKLGFKLGIGGVVTYKNPETGSLVESTDLEHILLETDSPYLTPVPERGKRNESANLIHIASKIAGIKNVPVEEVARITTRNAAELFNLKIH